MRCTSARLLHWNWYWIQFRNVTIDIGAIASAYVGWLQIDLVKQMEVGDVTNYQTNGEFDLVDFEAIYHEEYYSCCSEPYPDITYVIKMKRRPLFYVFNLILPCLLINGIGKQRIAVV